jgi:hypothetical protein
MTDTRQLAQQAIDAVAQHGTAAEAARALGWPEMTLHNRVKQAARLKLKPAVPRDAKLAAEVKYLKAELGRVQDEALDAAAIRSKIIGLKAAVEKEQTPPWVTRVRDSASGPGVPTLFLSDFHWGEVVQASQINGVNQYNLAIARQRLDDTIDTSVHLLRILDPKMRYPGIVVALGGDMVSGNIHEELQATNEINTMPTVLDLFGKLASGLAHLADVFGHVFAACVSGNHGRDTHKIWTKDRNHTSFDWLLYCLLAKHFETLGDKRITFLIPDGSDAYFRIYDHRYLLTHGDQFRGGDGMIGALGPIIRGDHKKRSRNAQIDMDYDTMLLGHWHQYIHHSRVIVNGSLKGYDEYAYSNNFGFEPPQQALWVTHPKYGITYRMPVRVDRVRSAPKTEWVSFPKAA